MSQGKLYRDRNLQLMFGVGLMSVMGVSSISPAFPRIVEELQISLTSVGMLIVAFTLPSMLLTPILGILADRLGRKRVVVPCLFLFGLAGGACALSQDFNMLIVLRVLQGIGAGGLSSLNQAIISDIFSGQRRAEALGLSATVTSVGSTSYPLIGGALATLAWNYPFLLALLAVPIGLLILRFLHNPEPRSSVGLKEYLIDTWGYLKHIRAIGAFAASIVGFILIYGVKLSYLSLYMGSHFHASPLVIGSITSSISLTTALAASQLGRLVKIMSVTSLAKIGFAVCAIALALIPFMPRVEHVLIPTMIFGAGWGIISPSLQTYVAGLAPSEHRAAFMSVNSTMFRVGQTLGPLIIGLAYVYGDFQGAFLFAAGLALATTIVGVIGGRIIR
ncbi:MFS transporter [Chloroflexota bacterium]